VKKVVFISVLLITILAVSFTVFSKSDYYHNFIDNVRWNN